MQPTNEHVTSSVAKRVIFFVVILLTLTGIYGIKWVKISKTSKTATTYYYALAIYFPAVNGPLRLSVQCAPSPNATPREPMQLASHYSDIFIFYCIAVSFRKRAVFAGCKTKVDTLKHVVFRCALFYTFRRA